MKTALTVLLVLILAADAVVFYQMRRLINGWGKDMEEHGKVLTDEEVLYIESRGKLLSVLSTAAIVLFLLRFVFFDLFPLIRG